MTRPASSGQVSDGQGPGPVTQGGDPACRKLPADAEEGLDRSVRGWLDSYREEPSPCQLRRIAEGLSSAADPGAAAARAGISLAWLREHGELAACGSTGPMQAEPGAWPAQAVRDLARLHRALSRMGVPCGGWAVSAEEIAAWLLRHARDEYGEAVRRMSPYHGWLVFELWGERSVPSLDAVAPGARDVTTGYAIRYVKDKAADPYRAPEIMRKLGAILPGLDERALSALRAAGIPAEQEALEHAARVCEVRRFWERFRVKGRQDHLLLAFACKPLLAEKTIRPAEIGTTEEAVWAEARTWVAAQVRQAEAGNYATLDDLTTFTRWSELGHDPFGITSGQIAGWEEAQTRERWASAQDGDGHDAFRVICHCSSYPGSWERVTGLHESPAKAVLQAVIDAHVKVLREQVQAAADPELALPPFGELRDLIFLIREVNDNAVKRDGKPLATVPWDPSDHEWREFCDRYLPD